jgi:tRNA A37 threonylcarbamoyladenosine synthetase subunit TsaC/SUA5/YrdC
MAESGAILPAGEAAVARAAEALRRGGLAAFSTEMVYGLGARADESIAAASSPPRGDRRTTR